MSGVDLKKDEMVASKPLSALEMINEWRKGCTCGGPLLDRLEGQPEGTSSPWECQECTVGLIEAMERNLKRTNAWQSIETAPKSPDYILLGYYPKWAEGHCMGGRPTIGYWDDIDKCFCDESCRRLRNDGKSFSPSHWMPLPAPPI